jgi:hypothetical protein
MFQLFQNKLNAMVLELHFFYKLAQLILKIFALQIATSSMVTSSSRTYASQQTYENGTLACSSIALHWALACLHEFVHPMCTEKQMRQLFLHSISIHKEVAGKLENRSNDMLMITDIIDNLGLPLHTKYVDVHFHVNDDWDMEPATDFLVLHAHEIANMMTPQSALVFTYSNHTQAIYSNANGKLYFFDSLPAIVKHIDRDILTTQLFSSEVLSVDFVAYGIFITKC